MQFDSQVPADETEVTGQASFFEKNYEEKSTNPFLDDEEVSEEHLTGAGGQAGSFC